jgi:hypothetical protein
VRKTPSKSARALANLIGVSVSPRTIQRELKKHDFTRIRIRKTPQVSAANLQKRLNFAKENLQNGSDFWPRVIFSDEKKWNLKGNDGYVSIWKEKTKKYTFETDFWRSPGVMVWGAICGNGARYLCRVKGKISAKSYQKMLEDEIFGEDYLNLPENFIFQQDNAPVHVAASSLEFFKKKEVPLLQWPPYSPDLNIIENLWGIVSRKVYEDGKEYTSADELWESVCRHFMEIPDDIILNLYKSVPRRLINVVELGGKRTTF